MREGDYKITINTNDNSYTIEEFSWGIVGWKKMEVKYLAMYLVNADFSFLK